MICCNCNSKQITNNFPILFKETYHLQQAKLRCKYIKTLAWEESTIKEGCIFAEVIIRQNCSQVECPYQFSSSCSYIDTANLPA